MLIVRTSKFLRLSKSIGVEKRVLKTVVFGVFWPSVHDPWT